MRVLVTGGAGFIGSWLTRVLLEEQHEVTVLDNLSKGFRELVPEGARFIEGDLRDDEHLPGWLRGHDAVIHMAAFIEVGRSVKEPLVFAENNIINSVRLLDAMHKADVGKIVFSSSATVYGTPQSLPIRETDPLGAQSNPYGASKVSTEAFVATYNQLYDMDAIMLRYFNPYGPNELHEPGDARDPELHPGSAGAEADPAVLERRASTRLHLRGGPGARPHRRAR